ncbi:MAG: NmrA family NAD(P)-binding protein [Pseudomonadota bacterium]|uniref:NmrA family NAD(P)-binding protein n=1 Tax=unclassified Phenylobacterium TaxID=2640670 RepID=UPI0009EA4AFB|nr:MULTISPECIES: NmrA family NAD(P)-binding protein [unclassified Phenylobacterium]MBT9470191.1 NmrA family NAD(P)-binding protein [Phenylobacterium sp.]
MSDAPILVTSAGGQTGSIGRSIVRGLRARGLAVRAFVRTDDSRAQDLREMGAEVFVGDLLNPRDVTLAVRGVKRIYFSMSLNPYYADATILMAAAAEREGGCEIFVNMSDFEQDYMTLENMSRPDAERIAILGADVQWSPQQFVHWAAERALDWSGLPVSHIQAAMFVENPITLWMPAATIKDDDTIRLPFGDAKTAPVATVDVAEICIAILAEPKGHEGTAYKLTGPARKDWHEFAEDFSAALGRKITYAPSTIEEFRALLHKVMPQIPDHPARHLENLALQNGGDRYIAEVTSDVERLLGRPATSMKAVIEAEAWRFEKNAPDQLQHRDLKDFDRRRAVAT